MSDNSDEQHTDSEADDIITKTITDMTFDDEPGTVYAVHRVTQGPRRVDWKVGHIDGTFANGWEFYHEGDQFEGGPLETAPGNAMSEKYKDTRVHELLKSEIEVEDGKMIQTKVYDLDGVNATDWAISYVTGNYLPETILYELWEDAWNRNSKKQS